MILLLYFFDRYLFKFYGNYKLYILKKNYYYYIKLKKFRQFRLSSNLDKINFLLLCLKLKSIIIYELMININRFYFIIMNFIRIFIYFFKKKLLLFFYSIELMSIINTLNVFKLINYYKIFFLFDYKSHYIIMKDMNSKKTTNILKLQTHTFLSDLFIVHKKLILKIFNNSFNILKKKLFFIWKYSYGHSSNWVIRNINFLVFQWFIHWYKWINLFIISFRIFYFYNFLILWSYLKECYYINRNHTNKSLLWKIKTYFGPFNPYRNDFWVFGNKLSGVYILKLLWLEQLN